MYCKELGAFLSSVHEPEPEHKTAFPHGGTCEGSERAKRGALKQLKRLARVSLATCVTSPGWDDKREPNRALGA